MDIKKLNPIKRKLFKFLTGSFQNKKNPRSFDFEPSTKVKILVTRPNHRLGNQLLATPLIQELKDKFPNCKIDLIVNGNLALVLFSEYSCINNIYNLPKKPFKHVFSYIKKTFIMMTKEYDLAIAGNENSNSSKIFVKISRSKNKIYNAENNGPYKPKHISKIPIYNLLKFMEPSLTLKSHRYAELSINLSSNEVEQGYRLLKKLFNNKKETICVYTYATGRKRHSKEWWMHLFNEMKNEFKNYNILEILPIENVSQIDFQSVNFYSKDLREIASLIENCTLFIGTDSGMMHLSAATNTPTIGLFNVTEPEVYGPFGNKNGSVNTNDLKLDEIIQRIKITMS